MKYLKTFENNASYEAAESGLILPNVSFVTENNVVHYNPFDPYARHEYVDLGLPSGTLWATMNVGASSITDYGNYYQYGRGKEPYEVTSGYPTVYVEEEDPLAASADTATQVWGGSWHMPTSAQCEELTANTTYEWTTINGVNGGKLTAQNGNYVFFPAAGHYITGTFLSGTSYYLTSTPSPRFSAYYLFFNNNNEGINYSHRRNGLTIRPVIG